MAEPGRAHYASGCCRAFPLTICLKQPFHWSATSLRAKRCRSLSEKRNLQRLASKPPDSRLFPGSPVSLLVSKTMRSAPSVLLPSKKPGRKHRSRSASCSLKRSDALSRFTGVLGILAVLLAAWLGSTDRKHIRWRTVGWGLSLQILFAFLVLRFDFGQRAMYWAGGRCHQDAERHKRLVRRSCSANSARQTHRSGPSSPFRYYPPSSSSPHSLPFSTTSV